MTLFNYIRPHWLDGVRFVSDAPEWMVAVIERWATDFPSGEAIAGIEVLRDPGSGLSVAILRPSRDAASTHDPAPALLHAIACEEGPGVSLSRDLAGRLFASVYGGDPADGLHRHEDRLRGLCYADGRDRVSALFIAKDVLSDPPMGAGAGGGGAAEEGEVSEEDFRDSAPVLPLSTLLRAPRGASWSDDAPTFPGWESPATTLLTPSVAEPSDEVDDPTASVLASYDQAPHPPSGNFSFAPKSDATEAVEPAEVGHDVEAGSAPIAGNATIAHTRESDGAPESPAAPLVESDLVAERAAPAQRAPASKALIRWGGAVVVGVLVGMGLGRMGGAPSEDPLLQVQMDTFASQIRTYERQIEYYEEELERLRVDDGTDAMAIVDASIGIENAADAQSEGADEGAPGVVPALAGEGIGQVEALVLDAVEVTGSQQGPTAVALSAPIVEMPEGRAPARAVPVEPVLEAPRLSSSDSLFEVMVSDHVELYALPTSLSVRILDLGSVHTVSREAVVDDETWYELRLGWAKKTPRLALTDEIPERLQWALAEADARPQLFVRILESLNLRSEPVVGEGDVVRSLEAGEVHPVSGRFVTPDGSWYELRRGWIRASPGLELLERPSLEGGTAGGAGALDVTEPILVDDVQPEARAGIEEEVTREPTLTPSTNLEPGAVEPLLVPWDATDPGAGAQEDTDADAREDRERAAAFGRMSAP